MPADRKTPKGLKVVQIERPWAALRDQLTGDAIHDSLAILNFCRNSGFRVSERTVRKRLELYNREDAPAVQSKNIRSGRANLKRAGA
jgi:hypothetical protein